MSSDCQLKCKPCDTSTTVYPIVHRPPANRPLTQQPKTKNHQPKTNNHKPKTNNHKPKTNNQQPTTTNQKPTTNAQQPQTNNPTLPHHHHRRCLVKVVAPHAQEVNPGRQTCGRDRERRPLVGYDAIS